MRISDWSSDVCSSDLCSEANTIQPTGGDKYACRVEVQVFRGQARTYEHTAIDRNDLVCCFRIGVTCDVMRYARIIRSDEHTSELQSLMRISYAVFSLNKKQNSKSAHSRRTDSSTSELQQQLTM